jgi:ubiquitin C-terminal hydrolase
MFFGSQQHDAQEFLNFLLDKLSENLNRAELEDEEQKASPPPQEKPKEQPTGE